jgi:hypothetical protein
MRRRLLFLFALACAVVALNAAGLHGRAAQPAPRFSDGSFR